MDWSFLSQTETWVGLLTLTALEIVLGVDNLVFISIISGKLPPELRAKARQLGLMLAVVTRILFLLSIGFIMSLHHPFARILGFDISGHDLILLLGGLFLIAKAVYEIHHRLEGEEHRPASTEAVAGATMTGVIAQILAIDLIFSIDSVVTAVGMVRHVPIMIAAVLISVVIMLTFVNQIGDFVERHPTVKMLALSFLILIGFTLVAEGIHQSIPKGYTYFAMAFALGVELLNIRLKKKETPPVRLRTPFASRPEARKS